MTQRDGAILQPREPIAIVGIGCRFAGIEDVESFWRILRDGVETIGEYPGHRFAYLDRTMSAESVSNGVVATRRGGFLRNLDLFDAEFFGISPREAVVLDPQQRLLLEVAWEAVEDAGIASSKLTGSRTGVYVGLWSSDYEHTVYELSEEVDLYATTGTGRYSASGRLAFCLDLRGPNLTIDTACSSSLVAVHLACASLRLGESDMAIAGGVNLILRPEITVSYTGSKILSPEGRCKFGDASADGYVRSEGAGVVLLKTLSRALADGDPIHAVIRGSSVNNDGRSGGSLVSPSGAAQEEVIRAALRDAQVAPEEIDYIEAHGTGTRVGDPVEVGAICAAIGARPRKRRCLVGSVKTNLGHTEAAAGIAGLIKTTLALEHRMVPASLHFREPNQHIKWNEIPVAIQSTTVPWPSDTALPIAGVTAFGITGTNAHAVLQSVAPADFNLDRDARPHVFLLSGHTPGALEGRAASWRDRLLADPFWPASLSDLAYTAAVRRAHLDDRLSVVARTRQELLDRLQGWLAKQEQPGVHSGRRTAEQARRAVFVFSGQGGQWLGMGRTLLRDELVFREALSRCDEAIRKFTGLSVTELLTQSDDSSVLRSIDVVQPVLFAVMVSLAELWRSYGVEPEAVVGHSMGEVAAAAVSGALSLDDAAAVICHRSRLMKGASGRGRMAVAELSMEEARKFACEYQGRISLAADNSPNSTVLSGDTDAVEDALVKLEAREIFCRRIEVDVASHGAHMDPFRDELARLLKDIQPRKAKLPIYSTTSGVVEDGLGLDAGYWSRNLRQPVLFSCAVQSLLRDGFDTFIEVNSHPVLLEAIEDGIVHSEKYALAVPSLRRDRDERSEILDALGALFVSGFPVDLTRLYPSGTCLRLPAYPWQRERHWFEGNEQLAPRERAAVEGSRASSDKGASRQPAEDQGHVYQLTWKKSDLPPRSETTQKSWMLIGDSGSLANNIVHAIETKGGDCLRVTDANDAQRALESTGRTYGGVIRIPRFSNANPQDVLHETFEIVRLVQTLANGRRDRKPPRFWPVTTGAWTLPGDSGEVALAQGATPGLARVIAAEYPEWRCTTVDLGPSPTNEEAQVLCEWLHSDSSEEQIAIRNSDTFVARYERNVSVPSKGHIQFPSNATYLLTGGLGGLGLVLARRLVHRGARHLALVSRRSPSDAARKEIENLESAGAEIRVFGADVSDDGQTMSLVRTIVGEMPPLRGVFHLPALIDGTLLADVTDEKIELAMRPKTVGAWSLHCHTQGLPLDHFVLFSSITAAIGQPGLAGYASANASLDALARYRRAKGLTALSIQWGPWSGLGLAKNDKVRQGVELFGQQGIRALTAEEALDSLETLLQQDLAGALVAPIDWRTFGRSFNGNEAPETFAELVPGAEPAGSATEAKIEIRTALLATPLGRARRTLLETHLQEVLGTILKTKASRIDPLKPLGSLGVDSLMALQLMRTLAVTTSVRLPATAAFNFPTLRLLSAEVARRIGISLDAENQSVVFPDAEKPSAPSEVAELSEEETIQALLQGGRTNA